ncbi:MAG: (2Fe-2S)-binding protein [Deltaproteobacteria bacterium]|nr:MAG: (2Fe-2S)-binding protein [Deltaproteobacteria bacterium]
MLLEFELNGKPVAWEVNPAEHLIDLLRRKGYMSVKWGCGQGDCGSCTVLVDGQAQRACLLFAGQVHGRSVTTAEALDTDGKLHPLQKSFLEAGAIQCGYCTPGMLLSAKALLDEVPHPTEEQVREAIDGNLCRCTGYKKIIQAVLNAAAEEGR